MCVFLKNYFKKTTSQMVYDVYNVKDENSLCTFFLEYSQYTYTVWEEMFFRVTIQIRRLGSFSFTPVKK